MKTDNVLVSREKWNELLDYVDRQLTYANEMSIGINQAKIIKLMPDFVGSEEDVEEVAKEIHKSTPAFKTIYDGFYNYSIPVSFEKKKKKRTAQAQAVINALKIKGD